MFQAIVGFSLRRRVFVLAAALILIGWGLMLAREMPIDLLPEIRQPAVVIVTEAGTPAAGEGEQYITQPMGMVVNGMPGGGPVPSAPRAAFSRITPSFPWGTDPYRNGQIVMERLSMVRDRLPAGIVPQLAPMAAAAGLIMHMGITGGSDPMALREYVDWVLRPRLLALEGVAQAFPIGGEVRTFRFTPNPVLMSNLGITLHLVEHTLSALYTNIS